MEKMDGLKKPANEGGLAAGTQRDVATADDLLRTLRAHLR